MKLNSPDMRAGIMHFPAQILVCRINTHGMVKDKKRTTILVTDVDLVLVLDV